MHRIRKAFGILLIACMPVYAAGKSPPLPTKKPVTRQVEKTFGFAFSTFEDDKKPTLLAIQIKRIACKGSLDSAKVKRGDFVVSIDGKIIYGLSEKEYLKLLDRAVKKEKSHWIIARFSEVTGRSVREMIVVPQPKTGKEDYESCGEPDLEG
jgi:hypothetical protein